jgi:hypothetical protein
MLRSCRHPLMRKQLVDLTRPLCEHASQNVFHVGIRIMIAAARLPPCR